MPFFTKIVRYQLQRFLPLHFPGRLYIHITAGYVLINDYFSWGTMPIGYDERDRQDRYPSR